MNFVAKREIREGLNPYTIQTGMCKIDKMITRVFQIFKVLEFICVCVTGRNDCSGIREQCNETGFTNATTVVGEKVQKHTGLRHTNRCL